MGGELSLEQLLEDREIRDTLNAFKLREESYTFNYWGQKGQNIAIFSEPYFGLRRIEEIILENSPKIKVHPILREYLFFLTKKMLKTEDCVHFEEKYAGGDNSSVKLAFSFLQNFPQTINQYVLLRGLPVQERYRKKALEKFGQPFCREHGHPRLLYVEDTDFLFLLDRLLRFDNPERYACSCNLNAARTMLDVNNFGDIGIFFHRHGKKALEELINLEQQYYSSVRCPQKRTSILLLKHLSRLQEHWKEFYGEYKRMTALLSNSTKFSYVADHLLELEPENFCRYYRRILTLLENTSFSPEASFDSINYAFTRPLVEGKEWLLEYLDLADRFVAKYGERGYKFYSVYLGLDIPLRQGLRRENFDSRDSGPGICSLTDALSLIGEEYGAEVFASAAIKVNYHPPQQQEKEKVVRKVLQLVDLLFREKIRLKTKEKIQQGRKIASLKGQYGLSIENLDTILHKKSLAEALEKYQQEAERCDLEIRRVAKDDFLGIQLLRGYAALNLSLGVTGIHDSLGELRRRDSLALAGGICKQLTLFLLQEQYPEELTELVLQYESQLDTSRPFDEIKFEFNASPLDNLINRIGGYCLFNNKNESYASWGYSSDPATHLLCLNAYKDSRKIDPIAAAILIEAEDKMLNPYLIVEGVLAGIDVNRIVERKDYAPIWKLFYENILKYAHQKNAEKIFFNTEHSGIQPAPHDFVRYVAGEVNRNGDAANKISYTFQATSGRNKVFILAKPPAALSFKENWFTHWLQKKNFRESTPERQPLHFADTWWLYNRLRGLEKPQWNECQGYVRGIEVGVKPESLRLGL